MKKDIQKKRECTGNIKPKQASYQIDLLERLCLTISSGDDIITDFRSNSDKKASLRWVLDISVIYLYFFSSHSFLFQNHCI